MAVLARASRIGGRHVMGALDSPTLAKAKLVCDFVNAEVARLRNQTIAIGAMCAVGAVLLPVVTGIGDPRIPLVLAAGVFIFFAARARAELARSYANIAMKRMVAALGKHLTFKHASSLTRQQFVAMDLFNGLGERWSSQDEIGGVAHGVRYSLHQVRAAGPDRRSVVFDGVVVKIDFADNFPVHTIVVPDSAGEVPGAHTGAGSRRKKDLVMLKNPAFERMFSVYAADYYEARRLVTPALMEIVLEAAERVQADLRLAFVQKSLFVAVAGTGLRTETSLLGGPLTPQDAVGKVTLLVSLAERLALAVAA